MIRADFETRVLEIEKYFDFLNQLEDENRYLTNHDKTIVVRLDDDQLKIFKANGFLLLYNLIESTLLNSVVTIFDEISIKGLSYVQLSDEIKNYWLKYKYKNDENIKDKNLYKRFFLIIEDVVKNMTLDLIDKLEYGGSIDARKIKEFAENLGIEFSHPNYNVNTHGKVLVEIKSKRNILAHGNESFANVGKNITYYGVEITDSSGALTVTNLGLRHFKQFTVEHLDKFIECIENYLLDEKYRIAI